MNRLVMVVALSLMAAVSRAADPVPFPNVGGSGDFSSVAAWGGSLPSSTTPISFATNDYKATISYKATADATFGKMSVMTKKATFDLTDANPKIAVSGLAVYGEVRNNDWQSSNASINFKGGT